MFSLGLAADVHQSRVLKEVKEGQGGRKHTTYNGAKYSIMNQQFSIYENCFVKCICTEIMRYELTETTLCIIIAYIVLCCEDCSCGGICIKHFSHN
jgi:hypothetical protein